MLVTLLPIVTLVRLVQYSNAQAPMLVTGAALFLASDLVLSMTYFDGNDSRVMISVNHVLYYGAQFAIALSLYYLGTSL